MTLYTLSLLVILAYIGISSIYAAILFWIVYEVHRDIKSRRSGTEWGMDKIGQAVLQLQQRLDAWDSALKEVMEKGYDPRKDPSSITSNFLSMTEEQKDALFKRIEKDGLESAAAREEFLGHLKLVLNSEGERRFVKGEGNDGSAESTRQD